MKAIRVIVDGYEARYNPAPDLREEDETDEAFLTRIAAQVGGEVVNENEIAYNAPSPFVPAISKAQALLWLRPRGIRVAQIQAIIDSIEDEDVREDAQIQWDYRTSFEYENGLLQQIWPSLDIDVPLADAMRGAALL